MHLVPSLFPFQILYALLYHYRPPFTVSNDRSKAKQKAVITSCIIVCLKKRIHLLQNTKVFPINKFICIFTRAQSLNTAVSFLQYNSRMASAKYAFKKFFIYIRKCLAVLQLIRLASLSIHRSVKSQLKWLLHYIGKLPQPF